MIKKNFFLIEIFRTVFVSINEVMSTKFLVLLTFGWLAVLDDCHIQVDTCG